MKFAVISDIHGNMDAFRQVLEDIDNNGIDSTICLGDCIGYGPEPDEVVQEIRKRKIPVLMGNHEMVVADRSHLEKFNPHARQSLQRTFELLSADAVEFICSMKKVLTSNEYRFVHGFPPDSVTTYSFQVSEKQLKMIFNQMKERICFIGHTHELEIIGFDGKTIIKTPMTKGVTFLYDEKKYILNVGSVGQPRDGNNNAKYIIMNTGSYMVEVRYVPYDIKSVVKKIRKLGLPDSHARRLL